MATFSAYVTTNDDNGYLWPIGPAWWNSDLQIGKTILGTAVHSAVRIQNVTIPKGSTINSAKLTFQVWYQVTRDLVSKISGMDEDNTATLTSSPFGRAETTAKIDWDKSTTFEANTEYDSSDISTVVKEIVDRGGWSSGNAMGFFIKDDGSSANDSQNQFYSYTRSSTRCVKLTVDYSAPTTTSTSTSTSSTSSSTSSTTTVTSTSSTTTSSSTTTTSTTTTSSSTSSTTTSSSTSSTTTSSSTTTIPFFGIKTSKPIRNVLETTDPNRLGFSSDYNTLKYYTNGTVTINVNRTNTLYTDTNYIYHNLSYYPFAVVYAKDDIMTNYQPIGRWQAGAGAYRQFYFYMTKTQLRFIATGYTGLGLTDTYTVTYKYKIYKNNLGL